MNVLFLKRMFVSFLCKYLKPKLDPDLLVKISYPDPAKKVRIRNIGEGEPETGSQNLVFRPQYI